MLRKMTEKSIFTHPFIQFVGFYLRHSRAIIQNLHFVWQKYECDSVFNVCFVFSPVAILLAWIFFDVFNINFLIFLHLRLLAIQTVLCAARSDHNGRVERVSNSFSLQFVWLYCSGPFALDGCRVCRNHKQVKTQRTENFPLRFRRYPTGQEFSSSSMFW